MACCNVKNLSWAAAVLHLLLALLGIILGVCFLIIPESEYDAEMVKDKTLNYLIFIGILIYSVVLIGCVITLMVALKKNRHELFRPYIFAIYFGVGLMVGVACMELRKGIRRKKPIGEIALDVFGDLAIAAIFGVVFVPVYMHYQKLRSPRYQPEQHGLSNNQPINKPYYSHQGGQI